MKKIIAATCILALTLSLLQCGIFTAYASISSGDLISRFELTDIAYINNSGENLYSIESGDITGKVSILNNTSSPRDIIFTAAVYDNTTGEMTDIGVSTKNVASKSTADFEAEVTVPAGGNSVIKTFVWDAASIRPYKLTTELTDKSSKKFDDIWLIYQMPTAATEGKKEYRKSFRGIVDEKKGTVTFEIPYGIEDADIIKDTGKLAWASLALTGDESSVVTCTGAAYNGSDTTAEPLNGEAYTGQVLKQFGLKSGVLTDGGWIKSKAEEGDPEDVAIYDNSQLNQINMATERPTITVTAEDGSKASYKINILFTVVDDDFSNAVISGEDSSVIVSGANSEWNWARKYTEGEGSATVVTEDGNTFLSISKDNPTSTKESELRLNMKDENGSWVLLDNFNAKRTGYLGDNVKVLIDYNFRYRNTIRTDNEQEYGKPFYYAFQALNGNGNTIAKLEFANSSNIEAQTRSVAGKLEEGKSYSKNVWYNDRMVIFADGGSYDSETQAYTGDVYADYYLDGCHSSVNMLNVSSSVTGTASDNSKDLSISAFRFLASTSASGERVAKLDLDNLKIGLLFD